PTALVRPRSDLTCVKSKNTTRIGSKPFRVVYIELITLSNPRKFIPVRLALFQESIAPFLCFVRHISQARSFAGKHLLSGYAIIYQVKGVLNHTDRCWTFFKYFLCPLVGCCFELIMRDNLVNHAHIKSLLGRIIGSEKKYFTGLFLAHLLSQQG